MLRFRFSVNLTILEMFDVVTSSVFDYTRGLVRHVQGLSKSISNAVSQMKSTMLNINLEEVFGERLKAGIQAFGNLLRSVNWWAHLTLFLFYRFI